MAEPLRMMQWIDRQSAGLPSRLVPLANINSGSRNLLGLRQAASWLVDYFAPLDAQFRTVDLPPREFVTDSGIVATAPAGQLLRWDLHPDRPHRALLAIHYDTVFGEDSTFQQCAPQPDGRLSGPGVADAKGGIVVLHTALSAWQACGGPARVGWSVVLNPDEELGSPSSAGYLQSIAPEFDFGLLFEPALPNGHLVGRRKGSGNFTVVVRGKAAHAGRHFHQGRNAVVLLAHLIVEIDRLNSQRPGATINVGMVHGGTAVNIVPDIAVARINARFSTAEDVQWFEQALQGVLQAGRSQEGFAIELHGKVLSPPKLVTPAVEPLMRAVEQSHQRTGLGAITWTETGGVCDGNKLAAAGLPNVDTLGPVGDGLHSDREWVLLESLPAKAKVVADLLARWDAGELPELDRSRPAEQFEAS
ncbi:MAG: hydrolase [Planctomycetota bacterium]|nr:MAG: hydrolase [Planctomycetota bacterium]